MSNHTKGKWRIDPQVITENGFSCLEVGAEGSAWWVAKVQTAGKINIEGEANAKLVAKAPEMLELLERIYNGLNASYKEECDLADWHNNNTIGVGIGGNQYQSYPVKPAFLDEIEQLLKELQG